ncbi:hypothetical protein AGMMS49991_05330 [Spirochaetia bacterium]|nr:hypothetical protein AGMMS49991_05260 [Spirochaetia bacterium]GHV81975.1 hypothetical protein AGMMS49991_05330 [Spirochaetia bacterium]
MKKTMRHLVQLGFIMLAFTALLTGCNNLLSGDGPSPGKGEVLINIGPPARTVMPVLPTDGSIKYHIKAEASGKTDVDTDITTGETSISLGLGSNAAWTITVSAYTGTWDAGHAVVAAGTAAVSVDGDGAATPSSVTVNLEAAGTGNGTLLLTIDGTDYEAGSKITIADDSGAPVSGLTSTTVGGGGTGTALTFTSGAAVLTEDIAGHTLTLPAGRYDVKIVLEKTGGLRASYGQIVEIWPALTSFVNFTAASGNYVDPNAIKASNDGTYYSGLGDALTAAGAGTVKTVTLLDGVTVSGSSTGIPSGVTLDTNGKTLTVGGAVLSGGSFTASGGTGITLDAAAGLTGTGGAVTLQLSASAVLDITANAALKNLILDLTTAGAKLTVQDTKVLTISADTGIAGIAAAASAAGTGILVGPGGTASVAAGLGGLTGAAGTAAVTLTGNSELAGDGISSVTITGIGEKKFVLNGGAVFSAPPTVSSIVPAHEATGIALNAGSIEITFSEKIKLGGTSGELADGPVTWTDLTAKGFKFGTSSGGNESTALITSANYVQTGNVLTLNMGALGSDTTYYLTIDGITDLVNNPLIQVVKSFTTVDAAAKTVSVGGQTGALTYGAGGNAVYTISTANIVDSTAISAVTWYAAQTGGSSTTAPTGVTDDHASVTVAPAR